MHYSSSICNFIVTILFSSSDIIKDEVLSIDLPQEPVVRVRENKKVSVLPPFSDKLQPLINLSRDVMKVYENKP